MSLTERQELQAIAIEADRQVGMEKREQDTIGYLSNLLTMAFLPGDIVLFAIVAEGLKQASFESRQSMARAGDVAHKTKISAPIPSLRQESVKPQNIFRKPEKLKVDAKRKIDFLKTQQPKRIDFRGNKVAIRPSNDTARRGRNKLGVKDARQRQNFRANLKPQTSMANNPIINNAQAMLEQEKQGLIPSHLLPKPPRPNGTYL